MHDLDHDERVAVAGAPRLVGEIREQRIGYPGGREHPNEGGGVGLGERTQRQSEKPLPLVELVQRLAEEPAVRELLLADRGEDQERDRREAAAEEREEAETHFVGPVQVFPDDDQRLPPGEAREKLADRLEEVAGIPSGATDWLAVRW